MLKLSYKSILLVICFILVISFFLYLFYPFESSNSNNSIINDFSIGIANSIDITSDRILYQKGNIVTINGVIKGTNLSGYVKLDITDYIGKVWYSSNLTLIKVDNGTALFSTNVGTILENETSGVYQIQAKYGNTQNTSSFFISTFSNISSEIIDFHIQSLVGNNVSIVHPGDAVMVVGTVSNLQQEVEKVSFYVEIRNENNVLVHSGFIITNIPSGESRILSVGWPVTINGFYTVYAYVKENSENSKIISNIVSISFDVV